MESNHVLLLFFEGKERELQSMSAKHDMMILMYVLTECLGKHWIFCSLGWETLKQLLKKSRFLLFCDHLTAQTSDSFKAAISNFGGLIWFGV